MAKRKRAPARRGRAIRKVLPPPVQTAQQIRPARSRRPAYTPELLAQARHDFEHTERSRESIAFDLGMARSTLGNLAKSEGWVRFVPPPRGLPSAVQLRREAEKLESAADENLRPAANVQSAMPAVGDTVERLYRAVLAELAAVENLRAQLKREPQGTQDAERTARILQPYRNLAETAAPQMRRPRHRISG